MSEFNQAKYIQSYNKEHYKTFKIDLKKEEWDEAEEILRKNNLTKVGFVRLALKALKEGKLKKEEQDN